MPSRSTRTVTSSLSSPRPFFLPPSSPPSPPSTASSSAAQRQQALAVRRQGHGVDAGGLLVDHLPLEVAEGGIEVTLGEEEEMLAVAGEDRSEVVEEAVAETVRLRLLEAVDPELVHQVVVELGVGQVPAVRGPGEVVDRLLIEADVHRLVPRPVDLDHLPARHVQVVEAQGVVGEGDLRAVRRPAEGVPVPRRQIGQLLRGRAATGVDAPDLILAVGVREVGQPNGRPATMPGPCPGRRRSPSGCASGRAPPGPRRRRPGPPRARATRSGRSRSPARGRDVGEVGPGLGGVGGDLDRDPPRLPGPGVVDPQRAPELVDHRLPSLLGRRTSYSV